MGIKVRRLNGEPMCEVPAEDDAHEVPFPPTATLLVMVLNGHNEPHRLLAVCERHKDYGQFYQRLAGNWRPA